MRSRSLGVASVLALCLAAPASAAPAHCFDSFGAPFGPNFDTNAPNPDWIRWVQARGGTCRVLRPEELDIFNARQLGYPPEYTANTAPAAPPSPPGPVLRSQPPSTSTSVWLGDTARATELLVAAYAQRGRPAAVIADTGRVLYRGDGVWRVFEVSWNDGSRRQIAVHVRPSREYYAIESDGGQGWSAAFFIGQ